MGARKDERAQLAEWFDEHGENMASLAYRYVQEAGAIEALLQEAFVDAADLIEHFSGQTTPRTWLTGILKRKGTEALRRRHVTLASDTRPAQSLRESPADLSHLVQEQRVPQSSVALSCDGANRIFDRLKTLPDLHRNLLLLREVGELDISELSSLLGISLADVRRMLFEGRAKLQQSVLLTEGSK